MKYQSAFPGFS